MAQKNTYRLIFKALLFLLVICLTSCTNKDAGIQKIDLTEVVEQIARVESAETFFSINEGFVYFGRETCTTCNAFLPILTKVAHEANIMVYYFDTGYFRSKSLLTEDELQTIFSDSQVLSVPRILAIREGQLYDSFIPEFNEQKDNTAEVEERTNAFLTRTNLKI